MLEIRPSCENCGKALPNTSSEAMICTFECTYCEKCVVDILNNVCPNCGGGFEKRPTRPSKYITDHPESVIQIIKPVDIEKLNKLKEKFSEIDPRKR